MSNILPGGFTPLSCDISPEARVAFDEALGGRVGTDDTPVCVSSQVVAGTRYKFVGNSTVPGQPGVTHMLWTVLKPLKGAASLEESREL